MKTETRQQLRDLCNSLRDLACSMRHEEESKSYEIHRLTTELYNLSVPDPEFYYEWGNEQRGFVSCGYFEGDTWHSLQPIPKTLALKLGLNFYCPYK